MTFLPIVERELRVMSRRPRTYWGRWATVMALVVFGSYVLLVTRLFARASGGMVLFQAVCGMLAWVAAFSGFACADSISEEKREGTLGLLFLTDLKGWDIVLGKLVAAAVPAGYSALGAFPIVAIALLIGGVSAGQFWMTSLALLNLLFLSHALALAGSALLRKRENAIGFPFLCLMGYILAITVPAAYAMSRGYTNVATVLHLFNPGWTVFTALSPMPSTSSAQYFMSIAAVQATAWLGLAFASLVLPYRWQDAPKKALAWRIWWDRFRARSSARRAVSRRELLHRNAFFWLVSRKHAGPGAIWAGFGALVTMVIGTVILLVRNGEPIRDTCIGWAIFLLVAAHLTLRIAAAAVVGGSLEEQRRNGGLELVLSCTPLKVEDVFEGEWLAWRRWLFRPAVVTIIFSVVGGCLVASEEADVNLIAFFLVVSIVLIPDMKAAGWLSMWTAMTSKGKRRGATGAAIPVILLPWVVIGPTEAVYSSFIGSEGFHPWALWLILALLTDYCTTRLARWRLEKNFRRWAVPMYDNYLGFWGLVGRFLGDAFRNLKSR